MQTSNHQNMATKARMPKAGRTIMSALMALTLSVSALPYSTLRAEETADSARTETPVTKPSVKIQTKGMTINGRPATKKEKEVVKQMTKQGARMASKGIQLAGAALTDPDRADQLGTELEAMGDEMERMGDSLESLAEDTVFIYDGDEDGDSLLLSDSDIDEISDDFTSNIAKSIGDTWWGKLFGGSIGILGAILGILIAILVITLLFILFTAPIWVVALIIWLIVRNDRRKATRQQAQAYGTAGANAGVNGSQFAQPSDTTASAQTQAYTRVSTTEAENSEMWRSGIQMCCLGVGLIVFFLAIDWDGWWGIGALVACLGVAKIIISYSTKKKQNPYHT